MKLLIITQKVNSEDSVLGFFIRWIEEFAKYSEKVTVVCLELGKHSLPMKVLSLGKEKGVGKFGRLFRLYKYIWQNRKDYDAVFVHMNQVYVLLCGLFWLLMRKKISLWYAHGKVSFSLRLANLFCHKIFTSTSKGLNFETKKKVIVGQGIDTELFKPTGSESGQNTLISVSRISRIKNIDKIIDLLPKLNDYKLLIVGEPVYGDDFSYFESLKAKVEEFGLSDRVSFLGPANQFELSQKYNLANVLVNLSDTGSLDKVILETMSCGLYVVTTNRSASELKSVKYLDHFDEESLITAIRSVGQSAVAVSGGVSGLNMAGRAEVISEHSIEGLISKMAVILKA